MVKLSTFSILDVQVSAVNLNLALDWIAHQIKELQKTYVCVAPVSTIMDCYDCSEYKNVVNSAGMVTPDGMPVVWLGRLQGCQNVSRTYGPDLMALVCKEGVERGWKHYFYGATEQTCADLISDLTKKCPGINIVGSYSPPFNREVVLEDEDVIHRINSLNPDIIWVGLGSPKQDFWVSQHRSRLQAPLLIAVGAAFDFLSGTKPQAPKWMQRSGLEWLFRLWCEPKRLWRRYLIGNIRFVGLVLLAQFQSKKHRAI